MWLLKCINENNDVGTSNNIIVLHKMFIIVFSDFGQ